MTTVSTSHTDITFVAAQIDLTGNRGALFGKSGQPKTESGLLKAPRPNVVLWRVIERAEIEKRLLSREIVPADDGQSLRYAYTVQGGEGGLMPIEEPGHFKAELVAVFAPPSFLHEVGKVEILTADISAGEDGERRRATVGKRSVASVAQLEGRLVRLPSDLESLPMIWFVEQGHKRLLQSPTCGRLRFGDGWQRLVQAFPSVEDASLVPDGPLLTLAECAQGKLIASWPDPRAYLVENGAKRQILHDDPIAERFGTHWRIAIHDLRPAELTLIPEGDPLA